jgi:hypothetical protein
MVKLLREQRCIAIFFISIWFFSLTGCIPASKKPEESVTFFFSALKSGDIEGARALLSNPKERMFNPEDDQEKLAMNIVFSKVDIEIISVEKHYDTATVKAKITSPNLEVLIHEAKSELLPKVMEAMKKPQTGEAEAKGLVLDYFNKKFNDAKMPLINSETDIKLKLDEDSKKWLIEVNSSFRNAVTGNAFKIFGM